MSNLWIVANLWHSDFCRSSQWLWFHECASAHTINVVHDSILASNGLVFTISLSYALAWCDANALPSSVCRYKFSIVIFNVVFIIRFYAIMCFKDQFMRCVRVRCTCATRKLHSWYFLEKFICMKHRHPTNAHRCAMEWWILQVFFFFLQTR